MDTRKLVEVLPSFELRHVPGTAAGVAGIMRYRGGAIPVLDLGVLTGGEPCQARLSTRILVVRYPRGETEARLGLRVESATETLKVDTALLQPAGVTSPDAAFLGQVFQHEADLVQLVGIEQLLTDALADTLYAEATRQ